MSTQIHKQARPRDSGGEGRYLPARDLRAPAARHYVGERVPGGRRVVVADGAEEHPLRARTRDPVWSFSWGRSGASARELAWAILYDSACDSRLADDWCSAFCSEVVARLPDDAFCLASRDVLDWLFETKTFPRTPDVPASGLNVRGEPETSRHPLPRRSR
jgi:hypothetical protein